jgi:glucose/arabinose dehydrogenase
MTAYLGPRLLLPLALGLASCGNAAPGDSGARSAAPQTKGDLAVKEVARFDEPWALAFLSEQEALVTERRGKLRLVNLARGTTIEVSGVPAVDYGGQGGLGDVVPSPRFASDGMVYLSWAEAGPRDTRGAVVGRARLVREDGAARLEGLEVIWRQDKTTGRGHYSHRLAFSPDGAWLYIASGDRQKMTPAQDRQSNLGKIVRLRVADPARIEQVSLGHRNILGLAFDGQGTLWEVEHGPKGGDEINRIEAGRNYGWPVVSQGRHYDGTPIPPHSERPDIAAPAMSWTPVIGPGGMTIYRGSMFPDWTGQAIIAGLVSNGLVRVAIDGGTAREVARIDMGERIRAIAEHPDGSIWLLEDGNGGRLLRLSNAGAATAR